jgi:XTP/dITP diphosphohydrolase
MNLIIINKDMELVFATHNFNKFKEVQLLVPKHIKLLQLAAIGCAEEIPETAATLAENALLKANYIKEKYGYSCFADDTGLEVAALNGAPGVRSARYAGEQKSSEDNIQKLLTELRHTTNRKACFKTVIALVTANEKKLFEGIVNGTITNEKQGHQGFGYDAVFLPEGHAKTFAQLSITVKNQISHRAKAVQQLIAYLNR